MLTRLFILHPFSSLPQSQTCSETNSTSAHAAEIIEHQQAVIRRQEEEIERLRTLLAQAGITPPDIAS